MGGAFAAGATGGLGLGGLGMAPPGVETLDVETLDVATLEWATAGEFCRCANSCWAALNTCKQAPQRTAPWAAPSWARFTRKLVRQWGHWVTKLSVMQGSGAGDPAKRLV